MTQRHTIASVERSAHLHNPMSCAHDVVISLEGAQPTESRYVDASGQPWILTDDGRLQAVLPDDHKLVAGEMIELRASA